MDSPKYIYGTYPEFFKGERFNTLLKPIENEKLVLLLKAGDHDSISLIMYRRSKASIYSKKVVSDIPQFK